MSKSPDMTSEELDTLLKDGLVQVPEHFNSHLVERITHMQPDNNSTPASPETPIWQWLALALASLPGLLQMTGFVFGIWSATAAG